jgi:tRNA threonylcarbamoyladenosine biosynthesis protein TsaB
MRTLFFDVSTNVMFVGLAKDDILIDSSIRFASRDHAKYLVDRIQQVLKRNRLKLEQIDEMIIGYGPGSYTGIRIAVVVGKMLAHQKNLKLKVISSLLFMTSGYEKDVCALIDARRGYVFSMIHQKGDVLLSEGYRKLSDLQELPLYLKSQTVFIDDRSYLVNPKILREKGIPVQDIHNLVPNYLRITEAEANEHQISHS